MTDFPKKRHSEWYERVFFSTTTQSLLTILLSVFIPAYLLWGESIFAGLSGTRLNSVYATVLCNVAILISLRFLIQFPGNKSLGFIISTVSTWYALLLLVLFLTRLNYSVYLVVTSYVVVMIYGYVMYFFARRWIVPKIALVPLGRALGLESIENVNWYILDEPFLPSDKRFNMIVVDLHSTDLTASWQKFLAQCVLNGIPVYNSRQAEESLTGRVRIKHMYENNLGSLMPSPMYSFVKRCIDIGLVLAVMPIALPLMVLTALAVVLESRGGALFIQNRVGKGGREFKIYKFRSMTKDSEKDGAQFASEGDMRVTRVGKFIRKTRLDELPQFFNVLKGDMSLIGPRPEQKVFVDEFEQQIPFYNYRHIVRPGISGWAQVTQGYAADVNDTKIKVEYDFYYIKHFSLWLDVLIVFKTLKTMLTGFGAR